MRHSSRPGSGRRSCARPGTPRGATWCLSERRPTPPTAERPRTSVESSLRDTRVGAPFGAPRDVLGLARALLRQALNAGTHCVRSRRTIAARVLPARAGLALVASAGPTAPSSPGQRRHPQLHGDGAAGPDQIDVSTPCVLNGRCTPEIAGVYGSVGARR